VHLISFFDREHNLVTANLKTFVAITDPPTDSNEHCTVIFNTTTFYLTHGEAKDFIAKLEAYRDGMAGVIE
jgi:hypothetical protein